MTRKAQVAAFLKSQSTLCLASVSADGTPHTTPLFYIVDDQLHLYWLSSATSLHSRNLKRSPGAAVSVYSPTEDWKLIRGVQMHGTAGIVTLRSERRTIIDAYCARFHLGAHFEAVIARSRLYRFEPAWVRYLDNSKRFGYKWEFTVDGAAR